MILIVLLLCTAVTLSAKDYAQVIREIKAEANPLLQRVAEKGVLHAYSSWARSYIAEGAYMDAAGVYQSAVADTFLNSDNRTVMAMELSALYNDHLLMHRSALQLIDSCRFSASYPRRWIWWLRMAQTKMYMQQYDEALSELDSIIGSLPKPGFDLFATRGYLHLTMQQYAPATDDLERAMRMTTDSTAYYRILSNLPTAKAATGDCAGAIRDISSCLRYAEQTGNRTDVAIYHRKRAQLHLQCGDTAAAATDYKAYWQIEKQYILENFATMTEQQRLDYWANRKPLLSGIFRLGSLYAPLLADLAVFRHQVALIGIHDAERTLLEERLGVDSKAVRRSLKKDEAAVEIVKYYDRGDWQYAALVMTTDRVQYVPLYAETELQSLPAGRHTLLQAVCSTSPQDKNSLYRSTEVADAVWRPLLPAIQGKKDVWFAPDGIFNLLAIEYLALPDSLKPAMHRLTSTGKLVGRGKSRAATAINALIVGGLDYNNMDSLTDPTVQTNRYGLDYWETTRSGRAYFSYLPGSRKEVDSITDNLSQWQRRYNESEERFKAELPRYNLVHLSTHGYSLVVAVLPPDDIRGDSLTTDNSLLGCGLAMSGANVAHLYPNRDDGLLTAREICELDLSGVEFAVVSACQSAQGTISDEGAAGLLRGLKLAGVKTVIATLWPVDDAATTMLMRCFYRAWQNGKGTDGKGCTKHQALRIAQQQVREFATDEPRIIRKFNPVRMRSENVQTQSAIYDAPYYWAPFILVDDIETTK